MVSCCALARFNPPPPRPQLQLQVMHWYNHYVSQLVMRKVQWSYSNWMPLYLCLRRKFGLFSATEDRFKRKRSTSFIKFSRQDVKFEKCHILLNVLQIYKKSHVCYHYMSMSMVVSSRHIFKTEKNIYMY